MNFDDLQTAWQEQDAKKHVTIESEALLKMVQRNHQSMQKYFFSEYVLTIVFGLIYVPLWIWLGVSGDLPWTWYLEIPAFLWVAGFLVYHRLVQRRMQPRPGDSLKGSVVRSLEQVNYQIQLQYNVLWWYLLPPAVPMAVFFIHCGQLYGNVWLAAHNLIVAGLVFWFAYELIRWGVRKNLMPRRKELEDFLDSLGDPGEDGEPSLSDINEK